MIAHELLESRIPMYCHICKKDYEAGCPLHFKAWKPGGPGRGAILAGMHKSDFKVARDASLGQGAQVSQQSVRLPGQYLHPSLRGIIRKVWVCRGDIVNSADPFMEVATVLRAERRPADKRTGKEILDDNFSMLLQLDKLGEKYGCPALWQMQGMPKIRDDIDLILFNRRRHGIQSSYYIDAVKGISGKAFIWFNGKHPVCTHRLYINVVRSHCVDVLEFVLQSMVLKTECHGVKILPPGAIGDRSDCIVVYLSKGGLLFAKQAILQSTLPRDFFGRSCPAMTERLIDGIGIGSGEEPPQVSTGLRPLKHGDQNQQSFVSFRSELLLAALLDIRENYPDLGHYLYSLFEGRVMDAFRGYGIDPSLPWQGLQ